MRSLSRRRLLQGVGATSATGLAGCLEDLTGGGDQQGLADSLVVLSWYEKWHERMLEKFRQEHEGLETSLTSYGSNEELYSKLKAGGLGSTDFIIPSNNMMIRMREEGMIQPIRTDEITRWDKQKELADQEPWKNFIKADGEIWGVPFTQGFFWNITTQGKIDDGTVPEDLVDSWNLYFEDHDARLGIKDYGRRNVSIVIWHLQGEAGDINEDPGNAVSWDEIEDKLVEMIENAKTIYSSSEDARRLLKQGQVDVINSWGGELVQLKKLSGVDDAVGHFPKEGSNGWFDSFALPEQAPHADASHKYMDFLLKPENQLLEFEIEGNLAVQPGLVEEMSGERKELFGPVLNAIQEHGTKLQPYAADDQLANKANEVWNNAKSRAG